ncbi:hypothetical protein FA95DRAFT_1552636 [Auriscalpium vulgare]|uniref:Uncharacterized protein n=1 Tax=Auriscalpium vulgare TaxID=40419 RepID=A0ACB8S9H6_9AGAM|nr:hypothetical protein FA95DRAFT_1552636 [Auriscalpium vulgare]
MFAVTSTLCHGSRSSRRPLHLLSAVLLATLMSILRAERAGSAPWPCPYCYPPLAGGRRRMAVATYHECLQLLRVT